MKKEVILVSEKANELMDSTMDLFKGYLKSEINVKFLSDLN